MVDSHIWVFRSGLVFNICVNMTYIIIYIISAVAMYVWVRIAHGEKGIFYALDVSLEDLALVIFPGVNTTAAIYSWLSYYPYKRKPRKKFNFNKFFGIKKEE